MKTKESSGNTEKRVTMSVVNKRGKRPSPTSLEEQLVQVVENRGRLESQAWEMMNPLP